MAAQRSNEQPTLFKKQHSEEEAALLKEYIRITNREDLSWSQLLPHLLYQSRTNLAFFINLSCFAFALYLSGWAMLLSVDWLDVVGSYLFADLLSGIVHIYLDHSKIQFDGSYLDFARMGFQVHHLYPTFHWMMDPHFRPYMECNTLFPYANLITLLNALSLKLPVVPIAMFFVVSFQATHYYAHATTHGKVVPWLVTRLQDLNIILSPRGHQQHHTVYTTDFCIFNGFMNWVCDWIMSDEQRVTLFIDLVDLYPVCIKILIVSLGAAALLGGAALKWTLQMLFNGASA